ncbi:MAG TPA: site-specific DNA-methyltransferase [Candidatus Xenobia bacterium]|jgi:site-specific DNA-methyltransferase (adenine-specific)
MATQTASFGASKRESHDATRFYERRLQVVQETGVFKDVTESPVRDMLFAQSAEAMHQLPDNSVALMVTSPPYHVGKDYDSDHSFDEYLALLQRVFQETWRVLEPGGRAVVNVANLGRRPYVPLSHLVTGIMLELDFFMRGEIIWQKAKGAGGNCAWGSWRSASNPVIRDIHEYCLCFSKGRFKRVRKGESTVQSEDFLRDTLSIWELPSEYASRVNHPAPFPVELPRRFIELYTFKGDLVLDPFIGSGSTAVAAVKTGRHYVGYDIHQPYVETANERIAATRAELAGQATSKRRASSRRG